jgi:hypothetical protein
VRKYTRAFFDQNLRENKAPLLDGKVLEEFVERVESFPPGERVR